MLWCARRGRATCKRNTEADNEEPENEAMKRTKSHGWGDEIDERA